MVSKKSRSEVRIKKHKRMRNRFSGTAERPRLSVFRSNNHMYAQIIDDTVNDGSSGAVEDDGACDGEYLSADTEDKAFGLVLYSGGGNGVCKARYRHESSRTAVFGYFFVFAECGKDN